MENILANQKALDKHMSKVSMNDEEAFFQAFFCLLPLFFLNISEIKYFKKNR